MIIGFASKHALSFVSEVELLYNYKLLVLFSHFYLSIFICPLLFSIYNILIIIYNRQIKIGNGR